MLHALQSWLDNRTGYRRLTTWYGGRQLLGGPCWLHTIAPCLFWLVVIQATTGLLLMSGYSPSVASAWASLFHIEQTGGGSFLRGMHYWGTQALLVVAAIYMLHLLVLARYRSPRELIWVLAVLTLPLLMVWAVTGNPLAGTQKGFAQITVESNIAGATPVIGPAVRKVLLGGSSVGNLTLTHLYTLHIAILPVVAILLGWFHQSQVRRHLMTASDTAVDDTTASAGTSTMTASYWPHQSMRNAVVIGVTVAVVAALAWYYGAPLPAPTDANTHHIPRPEWYFLFLFELREYFPGDAEIIATMIIPGAVMTALILMPLFDWILGRRASVVLRMVIITGLAVSWLALTTRSMMRDRRDAQFQESARHDAELAERARTLAANGVPPGGASYLLKRDAQTQGPILFAQYCAGCHTHLDADGIGIKSAQQSAPNLYGFGTRAWVTKVLTPERFASDELFGNTAFHDSEMVEAGVTDHLEPDQLLRVIAALSAEAQLPSQQETNHQQAGTIADGRKLIADEDEGCVMCHRFHESGDLGSAPDLTDYGSRRWLIEFISNPAADRFYRDTNDRMPQFAPNEDHPDMNLLAPEQLHLLVEWLRGT